MIEVPERLRKHLLLRENDSEVMYMDSTGNPTFGIGVKATSEEIDRWPIGTVVPESHRNKRFEAHIATSYKEAIRKAKEIGKAGNQNLTDSFFHVNYQLGDNWERAPGGVGHLKTWALIKQGRFEDAASEAENSRWFGQTPKRVRDFQASLMRSGQATPEHYKEIFAKVGPKPKPREPTPDPLRSKDPLREVLDFGEPEGGINVFASMPTNDPTLYPGRDIGIWDELVSSFALENDIWNFTQMGVLEDMKDGYEYDPNFHLTHDMLVGTVFDGRSDLIADVRSQEEFNFVLNWYNRELEHRRIVEQAGWAGIGFSMLAGILSPISLIPFGAGVKTASILRGTWKGARSGALGVGASELILQANQEFRPIEETYMGVGAGIVLMGAVGALGGAIGRRANRQANKQLDQILLKEVDAAVEDGDFWYLTNQKVRIEVRKLQTAGENAGEVINRDKIRAIFKRYGKKVREDEVHGLLDEERRMLLSSSSMDEHRNIIMGFDSVIDPKVYKALHREELLDAEGVKGWHDDAVAMPIEEGDLTPTQARLAALDDSDVGVMDERRLEIYSENKSIRRKIRKLEREKERRIEIAKREGERVDPLAIPQFRAIDDLRKKLAQNEDELATNRVQSDAARAAEEPEVPRGTEGETRAAEIRDELDQIDADERLDLEGSPDEIASRDRINSRIEELDREVSQQQSERLVEARRELEELLDQQRRIEEQGGLRDEEFDIEQAADARENVIETELAELDGARTVDREELLAELEELRLDRDERGISAAEQASEDNFPRGWDLEVDIRELRQEIEDGGVRPQNEELESLLHLREEEGLAFAERQAEDMGAADAGRAMERNALKAELAEIEARGEPKARETLDPEDAARRTEIEESLEELDELDLQDDVGDPARSRERKAARQMERDQLTDELDEIAPSVEPRGRAAKPDELADELDLPRGRSDLDATGRAAEPDTPTVRGEVPRKPFGFGEEMRLINGIVRELEQLMSLKQPTPLQRARMIYLRRRYSEFATESNFKRMRAVYRRNNFDERELQEMFSHPREDSIYADIHLLEKFDEEGVVRSRVDRLVINDLEIMGINEVTNLSPISSIPGFGKRSKVRKRLEDEGLKNVGDLKQFLANGQTVTGLGAGKIKAILGYEAPPVKSSSDLGGTEATPVIEVAEATWGFNGLALILSTPTGRILLRSPNPVAHKILMNLSIVDFKITRNYAGIGSEEPAELGIKVWQLKIGHALGQVDELRRRYVAGVRFDDKNVPGRIKTFMQRIGDEEAEARHNALPQMRWWEAVTKTLRNNNEAVGVPDDAIKHVEEAARIIRTQIFLPVADQFGYLTKGLDIDPLNYVFRMYNVAKIRKDLDGFRQAMTHDVFLNWEKKYQGGPNKEQTTELLEVIEKWIDGILSESYVRSAPNLAEVMTEGKGALGRGGRKRVVDVSDKALEKWLVHDLRDVLNAYQTTRIPDLEIINKFKDVKMTEALEQLDLWWQHAIDQAPETVESIPRTLMEKLKRKPRTKTEMRQQWKQDRSDIEDLRDVLRHTYALQADPYSFKGYVQRTGRVLRDLSYIRVGGKFAITALGDVGSMVLVNGFSRTVGDLVESMAEGLGRDIDVKNISKAELDSIGLHWTDLNHHRAMSLAQTAEYGGIGHTALERAAQRNSKRMAQFSLLSPWTNYAKRVASQGIVARLITVAEHIEAGRATPDEIAMLGRAHINESELIEILRFQRHFGGDEGGTKFLGLDKWVASEEFTGVSELKRLVRNLIVADVDRAVMTPVAGDSPIFFHTLAGKFLLQFKRFGVAHSQRLLVPAMQGAKAGNMVIINGLAMGLVVGSMVYMIKEMVGKGEIPTDVNRIIQEGVVRSDLWGSIGEMDGLTSALTGGTVGFRPTLGPDTFFAYHGRDYFDNLLSHVLGPSYSTVTEAGRAAVGASELLMGKNIGEVSIEDIRAWRRIMPYQNLFYLDWMFDYWQNGMEKAGRMRMTSNRLLDEVG